MLFFFINGGLFSVQKPVHSVSLVNNSLLHAKRNTFKKRFNKIQRSQPHSQALSTYSDFLDWVSCGIKGPSIKP